MKGEMTIKLNVKIRPEANLTLGEIAEGLQSGKYLCNCMGDKIWKSEEVGTPVGVVADIIDNEITESDMNYETE